MVSVVSLLLRGDSMISALCLRPAASGRALCAIDSVNQSYAITSRDSRVKKLGSPGKTKVYRKIGFSYLNFGLISPFPDFPIFQHRSCTEIGYLSTTARVLKIEFLSIKIDETI